VAHHSDCSIGNILGLADAIRSLMERQFTRSNCAAAACRSCERKRHAGGLLMPDCCDCYSVRHAVEYTAAPTRSVAPTIMAELIWNMARDRRHILRYPGAHTAPPHRTASPPLRAHCWLTLCCLIMG